MKRIVLICSIVLISACSSKQNETNTLIKGTKLESENVKDYKNSDIKYNYLFITSNNLDYITSDSYDYAISMLENAKLNYYVEYLKEKFSDKKIYNNNYTKEGNFRFLDEYYKTYIPGFRVSDIFKSMANESGFENLNLGRIVEMKLHEHDVYGLLGIACVDIDNDKKMEIIIIESKPNTTNNDCKFEYSFKILSYDGKVHESNSISIEPHKFPETSFEHILAVRRIDNEAYLYSYNELYNDYDGDSYGRGVNVYCFKNGNIEKVGGVWLDDNSLWDDSDEVRAERKYFIDKYYPQNMSIKNAFHYTSLCDISSKKINSDLDLYETANYIFSIRVFFIIKDFNNIAPLFPLS